MDLSIHFPRSYEILHVGPQSIDIQYLNQMFLAKNLDPAECQ